jgi:hypothetical protein
MLSPCFSGSTKIQSSVLIDVLSYVLFKSDPDDLGGVESRTFYGLDISLVRVDLKQFLTNQRFGLAAQW